MPRRPRFDLPGIPFHIVQRGNDRQACFFDDDDRHFYLDVLIAAAQREAVQVHAWVLMTNHVHLLATPMLSGAASRMMQSVGRRYVQRINMRWKRTGTLWEGRFRSSLVDSGEYALACCRYIELNPVRAKLAREPSEYRWSSHGSNALGRDDGLTQPHASWRALGDREDLCRQRYRDIVAQRVKAEELDDLRAHTEQGRAWGSEAFRSRVEAISGRCARVRPPGRPGKRSLTPFRKSAPPSACGCG